jgi:hypothetical protein
MLLGVLPYLARGTDPAIVGWFDGLGLSSLAGLTRVARQTVHAHVHLPGWFNGAASDAAFAFALGALLADAPFAIVVLGLFVVLGHEVAQGLGLVAGTFDVGDLVVLVTSFIVAQRLVFRSTTSPLPPTRIAS